MRLVVGGTGELGGLITRKLLEKGGQVRVLVRPGSNYQSLKSAGAQPVFGDLKDPDSLRAACEGIDTVITTANSAARGGEDTPETVELQGNHNLIDAARSSGVRHFIYTSALGSSPDSPVPFLQAKGRSREYLKGSGLGYTVLEPNIFMDVWIPMIVLGPLQTGRPVTIVGEGNRKHSFVARQDVAAFAVAAVDNPVAINQTIVIGGPEPICWRYVVARVERHTGREVPVRSISMGEPVPDLPPTIAHLLAGMDTYDSAIDMSATAASFGVRLTSLDEFLRQAVPL